MVQMISVTANMSTKILNTKFKYFNYIFLHINQVTVCSGTLSEIVLRTLRTSRWKPSAWPRSDPAFRKFPTARAVSSRWRSGVLWIHKLEKLFMYHFLYACKYCIVKIHSYLELVQEYLCGLLNKVCKISRRIKRDVTKRMCLKFEVD